MNSYTNGMKKAESSKTNYNLPMIPMLRNTINQDYESASNLDNNKSPYRKIKLSEIYQMVGQSKFKRFNKNDEKKPFITLEP